MAGCCSKLLQIPYRSASLTGGAFGFGAGGGGGGGGAGAGGGSAAGSGLFSTGGGGAGAGGGSSWSRSSITTCSSARPPRIGRGASSGPAGVEAMPTAGAALALGAAVTVSLAPVAGGDGAAAGSAVSAGGVVNGIVPVAAAT